MSITNVPSSIKDPQLRIFLDQLRKTVQSDATRVATLENSAASAGATSSPLTEYSTASEPTNLSTAGMFGAVFLEWEGYDQASVSYTEIWRSETDDRGTATNIGVASGGIYVDYVTPEYPSVNYYYWVRFVTYSKAYSPYNAVSGVAGTAATTPATIISLLEDQLTENELGVALTSRLDLIDTPTTGLVDALSTEVTDRGVAVGELQDSVVSLQDQIDGLVVATDVTIYYQTTAPGGAITEGSRWFDTDDGNHPYVYINSAWNSVRDQRILTVESNLATETTNRTNADSVLAADILTLEGVVNDGVSGVAALYTAQNTLTGRVDMTETGIATNTSDITNLETVVYDVTTGVAANASAVDTLEAANVISDGLISANSDAITALEGTVNDAGSGVAATFTALGILTGTVSTQGGNISANTAAIDALELTVNDAGAGLGATVTALNALTGEVNTLDGAVTANVGRLTALETTVDDPVTGVVASYTALDALIGEVSTLDGVVTVHGGRLSTLEGTVDHVTTGVNATFALADATEGRVTSAEGSISAHGGRLDSIEADINDVTTGLAATYSQASSTAGTVSIQGDAITAQGNAIDALGLTVNDPVTGVDANANAIEVIDTTISTQGGGIAANLAAIEALELTVNDVTNGVTASAAAIDAVEAELVLVDGVLSGHVTQINQIELGLEKDGSGNFVAIETLQSITSDYEAQWSVKATVGDVTGGIGLYNNGGTTEVMILADKFSIAQSGGGYDSQRPFIVGTVNGVSRIALNAATYIPDVSITTAAIANVAITNAKIASLAVDSAKIANLAVTEAKIANLAVTTAKIANAAIGSAQIGDAAINSAHINSLNVDDLTGDVNTISAFSGSAYKYTGPSSAGYREMFTVDCPANSAGKAHKPALVASFDASYATDTAYVLLEAAVVTGGVAGTYTAIGTMRHKMSSGGESWGTLPVTGSYASATTSTIRFRVSVKMYGDNGINTTNTSRYGLAHWSGVVMGLV